MTPTSDKTSAMAVLQLVRAVEGRSHLRSLIPSTELKPQMEGGTKAERCGATFSRLLEILKKYWLVFSIGAAMQEEEAGRVQEHICHQDK